MSPPATENAKGKFEAENTATGPTPDERAAQLGAGRVADGVGVVDRELEVRALLDDRREQPQLAGGAADLAAQARLAEAGLLVGDRDELVDVGVEGIGGGAQPRGAGRRRGRPPDGRGGGRSGELARCVECRAVGRRLRRDRSSARGGGASREGCATVEREADAETDVRRSRSGFRRRCVTGDGSARAPSAPKPASSTSSAIGSATPGMTGRVSASCPESSGSRCGCSAAPCSAATAAMRRNGVMPPTRTMLGCTICAAPARRKSSKR